MPEIPRVDDPGHSGSRRSDVPPRNVVKDSSQEAQRVRALRAPRTRETPEEYTRRYLQLEKPSLGTSSGRESSEEIVRGREAVRSQESQQQGTPSGWASSGADALAALRQRDEREAARSARQEEEIVGPPSPATVQHLREAQASAERSSSTLADVPPTPQLGSSARFDSFTLPGNTERQRPAPRPPRDAINTTEIDRDLASVAGRAWPYKVPRKEGYTIARKLLGQPESEQ